MDDIFTEETFAEIGETLSEEEWKTPIGTEIPKAKISNRVDISIDTKPKDVLKLDSQGKELFFEPDLNRFLELPGKTIENLSAMNRARYFSAYGEYQYQKRNKDNPKITERIKVTPRYSTATQRLEVNGKDPNMHYCWKRTDELRQAGYEGYAVADEDDLDTFGSDSGSTHTVGAFGDTELVLMKIPKEENEKRQRAIVEKSKAREKALDDTYKREVRKDGGIVYEDAKGAGNPNFTPAVSEDVG